MKKKNQQKAKDNGCKFKKDEPLARQNSHVLEINLHTIPEDDDGGDRCSAWRWWLAENENVSYPHHFDQFLSSFSSA